MDEKILFLTIKKYWFDKILSGEKTIEYREYKKYYINKFKNNYTHIILQAGYNKNSPRLKAKIINIEIKKINIQDIDNSLFIDVKKYFLIHLKL
jgi:hypothetical protein